MKKKPHFKHNESYKHKYAIDVLEKWIIEFPERFNIDKVLNSAKERKCIMNGFIEFTPDLTIYDKNGIFGMYEVVHTHYLDGYKLAKMQYYFYVHRINVVVFEIEAEYILKQTKCPTTIQSIQMI